MAPRWKEILNFLLIKPQELPKKSEKFDWAFRQTNFYFSLLMVWYVRAKLSFKTQNKNINIIEIFKILIKTNFKIMTIFKKGVKVMRIRQIPLSMSEKILENLKI